MQVAENWFEVQTLSNNVTLIREPHVLGGAFTNMWHVRGRDQDLLLDSGMGVLSLREHIEVLTGKAILCVASHSHFDHIGGHHEFSERVIHEAEASILETANPEETVLEGYRESSFNALPYEGFDPMTYAIKGARATRTVRHGDVIDLGDRHFDVLHLPGHSPGSIALWEEATKTLLSGDVVTQGQLLDELYHSDIPDYIESLGRIRDLKVDTVLPGHYETFGRETLVQLIDQYIEGRRKPACPQSS